MNGAIENEIRESGMDLAVKWSQGKPFHKQQPGKSDFYFIHELSPNGKSPTYFRFFAPFSHLIEVEGVHLVPPNSTRLIKLLTYSVTIFFISF